MANGWVRYSSIEVPTLKQIRILLADDHTIIRSGIKLLLEQQADFKVVAEANDGREAVDLVTKVHPNVAVLDIGMPQLNGIEATRQIVSVEPATQIVILSMHSDEGYVLRGGRRQILLQPGDQQDAAGRLRAPDPR